MNKEDAKALEDAVLAVEAAVSTLMLARTVLQDRLRAAPLTPATPTATMGAEDAEEPCEHLQTKSVGTMGRHVEVCRECGEIFGE